MPSGTTRVSHRRPSPLRSLPAGCQTRRRHPLLNQPLPSVPWTSPSSEPQPGRKPPLRRRRASPRTLPRRLRRLRVESTPGQSQVRPSPKTRTRACQRLPRLRPDSPRPRRRPGRWRKRETDRRTQRRRRGLRLSPGVRKGGRSTSRGRRSLRPPRGRCRRRPNRRRREAPRLKASRPEKPRRPRKASPWQPGRNRCKGKRARSRGEPFGAPRRPPLPRHHWLARMRLRLRKPLQWPSRLRRRLPMPARKLLGKWSRRPPLERRVMPGRGLYPPAIRKLAFSPTEARSFPPGRSPPRSRRRSAAW